MAGATLEAKTDGLAAENGVDGTTERTTMTVMKSVHFHLRFQITPWCDVEAAARDLVAFCQQHAIEEVALFAAAEEWNNGLFSRAEEDAWFAAVRKAREILARAGLSVSLNLWMTLLHAGRGRRFPADRIFQPMVSPDGQVSRACASFADPDWVKYICHLYGRFAALGFRVLWVEDDFRYHNHDPLDWGGGFEPQVLARFAKLIGRKVGRAEVVHRILKPGKPDAWRSLWLKNWRDLQCSVAAELAKAVRRNSPGTSRLGLMSSHPAVHSAEGRRWQPLFRALSIGGRVAHRPHFGFYDERPAVAQTYPILMLDLQKQFRPAGCEVAPEIENIPFTNWTKPDTQTWAEMLMCQLHGSDALLLDLFPFAANRASA